MDWARHPSFSIPVDRVTRLLFPNNKLPTSRKKSMVFLCGAADRSRRNELANYLRVRHHTALEVFYAEDVWSRINAAETHRNALEVEHRLAEAADLIVIVLESPGAIAELGAFSSHSELRKKLLPILETKYSTDESFINTGPIRWVNQDSRFAPALITSFSPISLCASELDNRIHRLPRYKFFLQQPKSQHALKHAIALVADVTAFLAPVSRQYLDGYLAKLDFPLPESWTIDAIIGLCVSMGSVQEHDLPKFGKIYSRRFDAASLESRFPTSTAELHRARARIVSGLQKIPLAWSCFTQLADG